MRYRKNTANALDNGERRLTLNAMSSLKGSIDAILPKRRNSGLPGGWGTPKVYDTAMNSPQSQYETDGAIVS